MKIKSTICALFIAFCVSANLSARRGDCYRNDFERHGKTNGKIQTICESSIDDNKMDLTVHFFQTIGDVNITVSDERGRILYSEYINAKKGDNYTIQNFEEYDSETVYYLNCSNGVQTLLMAFPVEM